MHKKLYPFTQNRELSWLKFNQRVLEEASDPRVPLLERVKFLSIFTSNLDEFFMVRCGSLYDLSLIDDTQVDKKSGFTPSEQLKMIYQEVHDLYEMRDTVVKNINQTLESLHISGLSKKQLSKKQLKFIAQYFDVQVFPLLSPQIIDHHHPFPHLMNKALYIIVEVKDEGKKRIGIIPVPSFLDRIVYVPDGDGNYMLLEQIILHNVNKVFSNSVVCSKTIIRVTRNADINLNEKEIDEDEDYRQYMKKILKKRGRLAPIRLEFYKDAPEEIVAYLCQELNLEKNQVFISKTPLELNHLFDVISRAPSVVTTPLLYKPFEPQPNKYLQLHQPIIDQVLNHDSLLFYPFHDIEPFLLLLKEASENPAVRSIKITIYRLANHSRIVRYLARAAENGKEVTVLMELRARFDEKHNIEAAELLEDSGCQVIYGFEKYKVHSKICMITLQDRHGQLKTITQIGTGNYNEKTSKMYTDISYITSKDIIGKDSISFFQNMALGNLNGEYDQLIVSPSSLKQTCLQLIEREIKKVQSGKKGQILLKMNSMTDLDLMKKLQEASQAGVKIKMVIRGICCLLPGLKGYTENIEVYSIVGRYLEHSRIYCFGTDEDQIVYISSADFMTRNTEKRVEIGCPIHDSRLKQELLEYFDILLKDNMKARKLCSNGEYVRIETTEDPFIAQEYCMQKAMTEAKEINNQPKMSWIEQIKHWFQGQI